ncbi:MAG: TauD/TfdA family dioxygenase [Gammaproteobacteria bacterium]
MQVEPLTPTIGAIVHDLDLRDVVQDDQLFAVVHDHWIRHQVLFFRDQALSATDQLALGERFGPLHIHPAAPYVDDNPALMQIHADADSQRNNGEVWHSDVSADAEPPMASILKIHQMPATGGDTLWASMYAVYESLSEEVQEWLLDLTATHHMSYTGFYGNHTPQRQSPTAVHPVIRTHPVSGQRALFVNRGFTRRINELSAAESDVVLAMLFDQVKEPLFHCRFRWTENAVAIWDNRCTQHLALWDYFPETRSGIRVTVQGDRPYLER